MPRKLRPIGEAVAVLNGKMRVAGHVVGYALFSPWRPQSKNLIEGWVQSYIVRLEVGCETQEGIRLQEILVFEEDLVTDRSRD